MLVRRGGAADKAPEWFKKGQKKWSGKKGEKSKHSKMSSKANAAKDGSDSHSHVEEANIAITTDMHASCTFPPDLFHKCDQDGDWSCATIDDKSTLIWHASTMKQADKNEYATTTETEIPFYCDSGATSHVSPNRTDFTQFQLIPTHTVHGLNGTSMSATGRGKIRLCCRKGCTLTLHDALHVPQAAIHLILIGQICDNGLTVVFN